MKRGGGRGKEPRGSLMKLQRGAGRWLCPSLASWVCTCECCGCNSAAQMKAGRCTAICKIIAPAKLPAQSRGREAEENQVSNALTVHHKGAIHGREEGFSPCLSLLPTFIEPILNFVLICKSRAKT